MINQCTGAYIEQSSEDPVKICAVGPAGNVVFCVGKNKVLELYDRTQSKVLWHVTLA